MSTITTPAADIVKRLRSTIFCDPGCEGRCQECPDTLTREAADEIERLRVDYDAMKQADRDKYAENLALRQAHCDTASVSAVEQEAKSRVTAVNLHDRAGEK